MGSHAHTGADNAPAKEGSTHSRARALIIPIEWCATKCSPRSCEEYWIRLYSPKIWRARATNPTSDANQTNRLAFKHIFNKHKLRSICNPTRCIVTIYSYIWVLICGVVRRSEYYLELLSASKFAGAHVIIFDVAAPPARKGVDIAGWCWYAIIYRHHKWD